METRNKHDVKHSSNIRSYARQIEKIYNTATIEAAALGGSVSNFNPNRPFAFSDYPATKIRLEKLLEKLQQSFEAVIINGIKAEWELSNIKNDEFVRDSIGKIWKGKRGAEHVVRNSKRYFQHNEDACETFIARKQSELKLSDRVWRHTYQFKDEIEMGIDLGLREGKSAEEIGRSLRQYLQQPDKLFRRVRDEHGQLHLSKRAAAYHPGTGVYRSSRKNALRTARTEPNIAYRSADFTRWNQLDFVVGIEIRLSNNHPIHDICDELKGRYPKDFKFTGWHPQCLCNAIPILKTSEEMAADNERILNGESVGGESINTVSETPDNFQSWVKDNNDRISKANDRGQLPYFLKDNRVLWADLSTVELINQQVIDESVKYAGGFDKASESLAKSLGVYVTPVNIKSERRIIEKATNDYKGDVSKVSDIIRNTFIADPTKINGTLSAIQKRFNVSEIKFQKTNMGYTGNLLKVWYADRVKAEIQVNTPQMIYAKEPDAKTFLGERLYNDILKKSGIQCGKGHKFYEEYRTLLNVSNPTGEQLKRMSELERLSREYYKKIGSVVL